MSNKNEASTNDFAKLVALNKTQSQSSNLFAQGCANQFNSFHDLKTSIPEKLFLNQSSKMNRMCGLTFILKNEILILFLKSQF